MMTESESTEVDALLSKMRGSPNSDPKELETFLTNVDEVSSLISKLASAESESDMEKLKGDADEFISQFTQKNSATLLKDAEDEDGMRTVYSKCSLNKNVSEHEVLPPGEDLMAAIEKDSEERQERRKANEKLANDWKEKGNVEFRDGNYEKAVVHYSEGLQMKKDCAALWTNRAQAFIKLEKFSEALSDCDWAIKVFENCLKAYIHRGRAYLGLYDFDQAEEAFKRALMIEPKQQKAVQSYLKQVADARLIHQQETEAETLLENQKKFAGDIVDTIEKLKSPDQPIMYYAGGLRVLTLKLKDIPTTTVFRTEGGFDLISEKHGEISSVLIKDLKDLQREELDLIDSILGLFASVCQSNIENQRKLCGASAFVHTLFKVLESKGLKQSKQLAVTLLHAISESELGRESITSHFDNGRLLATLFVLIRFAWGALASMATGFLNNMALDRRFKVNLRENFDSKVIPSFESLIKIGGTMDVNVVPSSIATMANLATDSVIRSKLSNRKELWTIIVELLEVNVSNLILASSESFSQETNNDVHLHKMVLHMLGFLINISQDHSPQRLAFASKIGIQCSALLKFQEPKSSWHNSLLTGEASSPDGATSLSPESRSQTREHPSLKEFPRKTSASQTDDTLPLEEEPHESTRALVLLSILLPQDNNLVAEFVATGGIPPVITFIQNGTRNQVKASVKVAAVCAQQCPSARDEIVSCKKALASIVLLLKHNDEHVIGNAALCLSHCIEIPKIPEKLTKTNIVKHLLVLARDGRKVAVQENCAILLAKLAMKEPRHLQRLRELHGIEILHTCMKHIKT